MSSPMADDNRNIGSFGDPFLLPNLHQQYQTPWIPTPTWSQDAIQQGAEPSLESLGYAAAIQRVHEVDGHSGSTTSELEVGFQLTLCDYLVAGPISIHVSTMIDFRLLGAQWIPTIFINRLSF
jgi:hypothetical protein